LQEYNGKNPYNNQVIVDFKNRKVRFNPVKGSMSSLDNYLHGGRLLQKIVFRFILFFFIISILLDIAIDDYSRTNTLSYILICYVIYFMTPYIYIIPFLMSKKFKNNTGVINAKLSVLYDQLNMKPSQIKEGFINKKLITSKSYDITDFQNIFLEYKLTGDFKKYIKTINIVNDYSDNPYIWTIIFEWTKKPTKGNIWVKYL